MMPEYERYYQQPEFSRDNEPLCGNPNCIDGWVIEIVIGEFGEPIEDKCSCKICN